jgi:ABC-type sugar transport system ATPase subunit
LKAIAGAHLPSTGSVVFGGVDITVATPDQRARSGMSLKFQITAVLPELSVYDNVLLALQAGETVWSPIRSHTRRRLARGSDACAGAYSGCPIGPTISRAGCLHREQGSRSRSRWRSPRSPSRWPPRRTRRAA